MCWELQQIPSILPMWNKADLSIRAASHEQQSIFPRRPRQTIDYSTISCLKYLMLGDIQILSLCPIHCSSFLSRSQSTAMFKLVITLRSYPQDARMLPKRGWAHATCHTGPAWLLIEYKRYALKVDVRTGDPSSDAIVSKIWMFPSALHVAIRRA